MKTTIVLSTLALLAVAPALVAQDFDFKSLDRLGTNASKTTSVTLDGDTLKLAASFLGSGGDTDKDAAGLKTLVANLKAIYVRSWQFAAAGQYSEGDVAPFRAFLKQPVWKTIVDVRDGKESTQVYLLPVGNNKLGGVAVLSTLPTEVTIVYINGTLEMNDLQKLSGNMGIPEIKLPGDRKGAK